MKASTKLTVGFWLASGMVLSTMPVQGGPMACWLVMLPLIGLARRVESERPGSRGRVQPKRTEQER